MMPVSLITSLVQILLPLILTIYFIFFGKLIYRLVSHFVRSRPEDLSLPTGYCYCETIVRFIGLWVVGKMAYEIYSPIMIYFRSALMTHFLNPDNPINPFVSASKQFFNMQTLFSFMIYLTLEIVAVWYFLAKGKIFINLLNRLWLKVSRNNVSQNPVIPV